jgi:hypothetical protein
MVTDRGLPLDQLASGEKQLVLALIECRGAKREPALEK